METRILLLLVLFDCGLLADGCSGNRKDKDSGCKWRVEVEVECRRRRSLDNKDNEKQMTGSEKKEAPFSIKLRSTPCSFNSYDVDRDGTITKEEVQALLCGHEDAEMLFSEFDVKPEDGVIKPDEFYSTAPLIIAECSNSDKTSDLKVE
ncbi:uncharacterized protein LOC123543851 [Mercenaria mercenaria]|uniref:uncharacterized protein LOC123543851 n=1 Tax=Mercenaria mercenaria TaxID=6596 RepID=UPI00234F63C2|nr:uncharacterized protein LOC123543851 [Mercenaria mercenaria]